MDNVIIFAVAVVCTYFVARVWRYIWWGLLLFVIYTVLSWLSSLYIGTSQTEGLLDDVVESEFLGRVRNESKIVELAFEVLGRRIQQA